MIDFKKLQNECGFYSYGFSKTDFRDFSYAVSLVFKLSDAIATDIKNGPTYEYFHHYRTVNSMIDRAEYLLGRAIENKGYRYLPIAASQTVGGHDTYKGLFSHKIAAVNAGLGVIGRNALFIANGIGCAVRLGTVFTDMPFEVQNAEKKKCIGCGKCAAICPAQAIYNIDFDPEHPGEDLVDRQACSSYMKRNFQHIGRGAVCGMCMANCPMKP